MASKNNSGIRTIHDAIDTKVNRVFAEIRTAKSKRQAEITKEVFDKSGFTKIEKEYKRLTGRSCYQSYDCGSLLDEAMKVAVKELTKYDELEDKIRLLSEDCHIQVVTGEFGMALGNLEKKLQSLLSEL